MAILDAQERSGRVVAYDRFDEFFRSERVPDKIALEVWERHLAVMNQLKQELERFGAWVRVLVPAHKTGTPFTKPVDPLVGRAIEAWEAVRPVQPPLLDPRTGERVPLLFWLRGSCQRL